MRYRDIIDVNENFQYSVNLQFDINNIEKIKEYIPTKDGCELLKSYLNSIIHGKNRATTLIGPYGKGKSHLLLVLITLLDDYEKEDISYINEFMLKIKRTDEELYEMIKSIRKDNQKVMPVIINSNYGDLNQAFLLALSEALERENLSDVIVNTYFDVAVKVIEKWEENYKDAIDEIKKCLKEYDCSLKALKSGLKNYSEKHYDIFKNVYSCILHGQEFNPLVNSDIIKTYKDMTHELSLRGYKGIFIAFDEFSKFLEYVENSHMMKDLKLLQDFAELANRTGNNEQIHLCCITHKTMNQYANNMDEDRANAFKTVEGRFKEVYFNRSLEQNYEIVSYALEKRENFDEYYVDFYKKNKSFYEETKDNNVFRNTENIEEILFKGCFPLNPITTYSLIELSEKIAQNERTLFTFLTDDDTNSLKSFIDNGNNTNRLFNIDKIYDYFKPLLKKSNETLLKEIWIKSENAISKCKNETEKNVIKSLAIIYMINDLETLIPDDNTLKTSLHLSSEEYEKIIDDLVERSIIKRKKITNELDFATIYNREISKEIKRLSESDYYDIDIKETLNEIINPTYSLPRRYNEEYKITRFFSNVFMNERELTALGKFDILFEKNYCDGMIINLIRDSRNIQEIRDYFSQKNNEQVILIIPKTIFPKSIISLLRDYKSIEYLLSNSNNEDEMGNELELIKKETIDAINEQVSLYFSNDNIQEYLYKDKIYKKVNNISSFLSDICINIYDKTPIINNEMINKRELSAPIKKARDIVIETILNNDENLIKSKTSAEATIYKAIVEKKNTPSINEIIKIINKFISESENNKIGFDKIYRKLENKPYAIRKGIIPILIAMALYNYSDIIVIYFMNKEIDLDATNFIKINENPEKYFILTEKGTAEKIKYLSNLMYIFNVPNLDTQRVNLKKLVDNMRRWILSLPRILREYDVDNNNLNIKEEYINVKNELLKPDINNNEFIYKELCDIFNTNNYMNIVEEIKNMKLIFDNFISMYSDNLINNTKQIVNKSFKGSLTSLLKEFYEENKLNCSHTIYNLTTKEFIDYIGNITTHDEQDVIEKMSKITTGFYIEDWQPGDYKNFSDKLTEIIGNIKNTKGSDGIDESNKLLLVNGNEKLEKYIISPDEISAIGNTMKNNIEEVMNEYGDSLSEKEKISVLVNIIKKYL